MNSKGYIIDDYNNQSPFASFLPGIAGTAGVPIWAYYVNRGQALAGFGIRDKDHAIMEFSPAVTAYEDVSRKGFRTFLKSEEGNFELFSEDSTDEKQEMCIYQNALKLKTLHQTSQIGAEVLYCMLPNERVGALIRRVTIRNCSEKTKKIDLIDGMARVLPYGIQNGQFKEMANLLKSYAAVSHWEKKLSLFAVRASVEDSAEVEQVKGAYFYCSITSSGMLPTICDPEVIFGYRSGMGRPQNFYQQDMNDFLAREQYCDNKIPCAFTPLSVSLDQDESITFYTLIGFFDEVHEGDSLKKRCDFWEKKATPHWFEEKIRQARESTEALTKEIFTKTNWPLFDEYVQQCYLDNLIRGGYPFLLKSSQSQTLLHLFSRKHGDLERDYNFFVTEDVHYSQGNGNFRDVCQNRRDEIFFHPEIEQADVLLFVNLLQIDGYNPLEIQPNVLVLQQDKRPEFCQLWEKINLNQPAAGEEKINDGISPEELIAELQRGVTVGRLWRILNRSLGAEEGVLRDGLLQIMNLCGTEQRAVYKEGYWSDHFTYIITLVNNYFKMYPDQLPEALFNQRIYKFYESPAMVLPRHEKYCIKNGRVYQYGATIRDENKAWNPGETHWLKDENGNTVYVTLFEKLYFLLLIKFATLDPLQRGIEMEAGKPGWNDAMNGLPGLIGSSSSELIDLLVLAQRLSSYLTKAQEKLTIHWNFLTFDEALFQHTMLFRKKEWDSYRYWDETASLREAWRRQTRNGFTAVRTEVSTEVLKERIAIYQRVMEESIKSQSKENQSMIPTYYLYHAKRFEEIVDHKGQQVMTPYGLPAARVSCFEAEALPVFLEAPAKLMGQLNKDDAKRLYHAIKKSDLFDRRLNMYKTSGSIEKLSMEIGRIRAFTPGWFERESIFLHMQYKYLLSLLEAKLYDIFFSELHHLLIPFMNSKIYGRSIMENSSFLASSANPDPHTHGKGYVSRLSGSTAEVISMWIKMFLGDKLFRMTDGQLNFSFEPILSGEMFGHDGKIEFVFLDAQITYSNRKRKSTFGQGKGSIAYMVVDHHHRIEGNQMSGEYVSLLRSKKLKEIEIVIE